ncbi:hypothetical protein V8E36_007952 [Tilletia maclaganii]
MVVSMRHARTYIFKQSKIGSRISGLAFLRQYTGKKAHPKVCRDFLGLTPVSFKQLLKVLVARGQLKGSHQITAEEKLGIFLHMARSGATCRLVASLFGRAVATIAKYAPVSVACGPVALWPVGCGHMFQRDCGGPHASRRLHELHSAARRRRASASAHLG